MSERTGKSSRTGNGYVSIGWRKPNDLALIGVARDGRGWLLQARGPVVLVMQSATANRATELAEEAWKDLEIEAEPTVVRFESARRPVNYR